MRDENEEKDDWNEEEMNGTSWVNDLIIWSEIKDMIASLYIADVIVININIRWLIKWTWTWIPSLGIRVGGSKSEWRDD